MTFTYNHVQLVRVIDGDTVELDIDMGNKTIWREKFRIRDLDCHETRRIKRNGKRVSEEEVESGKAARVFAMSVFANYGIVSVTTHKQGKYGRYLADIKTGLDDYASIMQNHCFDRRYDPL